MKIVYENTIDDIVAFTCYHYAHSRTVRQMQAAAVWGSSFVIVLIGVAVAVAADDPFFAVGVALSFVVLGGLNALFQAWYYPRYLARYARKFYREGKNKAIGPHELELTDSGLVERNESGATMVRFKGIEKVVSSGKHVFIYVDAMSAHVIPCDAVSEGNWEQFVESLTQRMENAAPSMD
jgi:hypothetical protein